MVGHTEPTHMRLQSRKVPGFTIVELLIVIVVIGILAALVVVAFNGVQARARETQMKADLSNTYKKILADKILADAFPSSLAVADGGKGISPTSGGSYQYSVDNTTSPPTFCITYVKDNVAYYINQDNQVATGACAGHSLTGYTAPAMIGYSDFSANYATSTMTIAPSTTIADGSWMIVDFAFYEDTTPTMPAGWTTLFPRASSGTLRNIAYGKIKQSSDTFPMSANVPVGVSNTTGAIMWGSGASAVSNWVVGDRSYRDGGTPGQYRNVTPVITTATPQSLVITLSNERTSITETDISSITGATKWFFVPQNPSRLQTITVGSFVQTNTGVTPPVTVTYPNPQVVNGLSVQIALPPG